ncbi:MAG: hypothetical protein IKO19_08735, partial [Candidatus Riflebacteria bacterium]|nr:hypothetical protein [Candidatus Riflebacteria bacterium]
NRSKRDKNFYQDKKYLSHINLDEVESKFSFTTQEDLEWMDMPYEDNDYDVLQSYYTDYCSARFEELKKLFCKSMGIDYETMQNATAEDDGGQEENTNHSRKLINKIENNIGEKKWNLIQCFFLENFLLVLL